MSVNSKMTTLADEIRELSGTTAAMGLDAMATHVGEANDEVDSQAELIAQIASALEGKGIEGGEQATPVISVNTSGLITATAGSKSATKQLAFQPAKTITPSTASQIAVSSGYYTGGNITVAGDSNLVAKNIKSGVSIFGVSGTLVEGSNEPVEWSENEDAIVRGTISVYTNNITTSIDPRIFYQHNYLTSVNFTAATYINTSTFAQCYRLINASFPVAIYIDDNAFYNCYNLANISFPAARTIGSYAFGRCASLTTASFPSCNSIGSYAFASCWDLTTASFPSCNSIGSYAFAYCHNLSQIYLTSPILCTLSNSNAFLSTPYTKYSASFSGTPYIYVPESLLTAYQTATNWAYFSSYFSGVYIEDSGDSGDSGIITFTIDANEYQALSGMTWREWVNSSYNTDNYFINNPFVMANTGYNVMDSNYNQNLVDNVILPLAYRLVIGGGGAG